MDCCGSNNPERNDKDIKAGQKANENNPFQKEQAHSGGCCGGGSGWGMWVHLILMIIVVLAITYFTRR